jgi:hypothetical protein
VDPSAGNAVRHAAAVGMLARSVAGSAATGPDVYSTPLELDSTAELAHSPAWHLAADLTRTSSATTPRDGLAWTADGRLVFKNTKSNSVVFDLSFKVAKSRSATIDLRSGAAKLRSTHRERGCIGAEYSTVAGHPL